MIYQFITAKRAVLDIPLQRLCQLLSVSVSGYYTWRKRIPSKRQLDDIVLLAHIRAAYKSSRSTYGPVRIWHELMEAGVLVGRDRVRRLMKAHDLFPLRKQKFKKTTDSDHSRCVAPNLLNQDFTAPKPNQKWVVDISYIWTAEGWLYLACVIDLFSRRVVGWSVDKRMKTDLPLRALRQAIAWRQPPKGVIHHSDRGSQYCSDDYQKMLLKYGFEISMSGKGNCYDNAAMETFFKTIKAELIWRTIFMTREQAKCEIENYIEGFYNPVRRHSTLGYKSPVKFEMMAA